MSRNKPISIGINYEGGKIIKESIFGKPKVT